MYKNYLVEETVICVDVSGSMAQEDISPSRLDAAKNAFREFCSRKNIVDPRDKTAVVAFGETATVECSLTNDISVLKKKIDGLDLRGSTAIGDGLKLSIDALRKGKAIGAAGYQARIILLSDGGQNAGIAQPLDVAREAAKMSIKIHTVSIGHSSDTDPDLLREIAQQTGGEFAQIDSLQDFLNHFTRPDMVKLISSTGGIPAPAPSVSSGVLVSVPIETTVRMQVTNLKAVTCKVDGRFRSNEPVFKCTGCGSYLCYHHGNESVTRKQCMYCKAPIG